MNSNSVEEVARVVRRESARKQRTVAGLAYFGFAMDAGQMAEMSSADVARHALKSLGLKIGSDPVEALDFYLAGLQQRGRPWAADATALPADNAIEKFFRELDQE
jgi:hypothetical protein